MLYISFRIWQGIRYSLVRMSRSNLLALWKSKAFLSGI